MKISKSTLALFVGPAVLCYILIFLYPVTRTFVMSFFDVALIIDPISTWSFNWFENYIKVFGSAFVQQSFRNIFNIWIFGGIPVMLLALIFAVILTSGVRLKRFFKASIYLPNIISTVAMATMWIQYVYHGRFGLLRELFTLLGMEDLAAIPWTGPDLIGWSMLVAFSFGMIGFHMLIFIAGIERIPTDLFESATIDGAGMYARFSKITFPLLKGVLKTNLILWSIAAITFFAWAQMFSTYILSARTITPMAYVYNMLFGVLARGGGADLRDSGAAAAISVVLTLIVVIVFLLINKLLKKDTDVEF